MRVAREKPHGTRSRSQKNTIFPTRRPGQPPGKSRRTSTQRFDLEYAWQGDHIEFKRPGLTGALHVGKDAVRLNCELGFMLSLLKPSIEAEVHKQFDKYFGKAK